MRKEIFSAFLFFLATTLFLGMVDRQLVSGATFKLPDSDQKTCYNSSGSVVSCSGTGQDAAYSKNPMSFTNNGNGTVTDNNTGLIWQKDNVSQTYTYDQAISYCSTLSLGSGTGWRLPSIKELTDILDYNIPAAGPLFPSVFSSYNGYYWSATDGSIPGQYASYNWAAFVDWGKIGTSDKANTFHVRCVRGTETTGPNFTINDSKTVTDTRTNLAWQRGEPGAKSWSSALTYCEGLDLGGSTSWRLPNVKEIQSIVNETKYNPAVDKTIFTNIVSGVYWTSTSYPYLPANAWRIDFTSGNIEGSAKTTSGNVKCVCDADTLSDTPTTSCTRCGAYGVCLDSGLCGCSPSTRKDCNQDLSDGCEVDSSTDVNHCGYCSTKCKSGQTCESGLCKGTPTTSYCTTFKCGANATCDYDLCYCNTGYKDCNGDKSKGTSGNGCEIYSYGDVNNCGSCGYKCSSGYSCQSGRCTKGGTSSSGSSSSSSGKTSGSTTSCSGLTCGPNTYCYEGQCLCSAGTKNCDGTWDNGCECGRSYTSCQDNKCGCQPGFYDCDGDAYNGCESSKLCPTCTPSDMRSCSTVDSCSGKQICDSNGYWGNCVVITEKVCTPYATAKCSPTINGAKCPTLSGTMKCNGCGTGYSACSVPAGTVCCPGKESSCSTGQCSGTKICSDDGQSQGSCVTDDGTVCCEQDADCNDFNGCTTEKCVNTKCEYTPLEDCRSLTPVKCRTDANCASKDSCVGGACTPLQCNENFIIENHKCVCTGKECGGQCHFSIGICCSGNWNDEFDSCTFDFGYYEERVTLSLDQEAGKILVEAKGLSAQGKMREGSVLAKIAVAMAEIKLSTQSDVLKNQATALVNEAKTLFASGNYSLALDKVDEALGMLDGKTVQTKVEETSLWQKNKVPIAVFSTIAIVLVIFIFYVIIVPKI